MKKEIRQTIKTFYPKNIYRLPQDGKQNLFLDEAQIFSLAKKITKTAEAEVDIEKDDEYGISWNYGIFFPSKNDVYVNRKATKLHNTAPKYVLYVSISNLARYYMSFWNELKMSNGTFKHRLLLRNPRSDLRTIESKIRKLFEEYGFSRLTRKELNEEVKWLRPGKSAIEGVPTVYNCLFSEV